MALVALVTSLLTSAGALWKAGWSFAVFTFPVDPPPQANKKTVTKTDRLAERCFIIGRSVGLLVCFSLSFPKTPKNKEKTRRLLPVDVWALVLPVKLTLQRLSLKLARKWAISSRYGPGGGGGSESFETAIVQLTDKDQVIGLGEAAPSNRYKESIDSTIDFLNKVDAGKLSFTDVAGSMEYLEALAPGNFAAKGAINIALMDGAGHVTSQAIYDYLKLGFAESKHVTSFSIGIDSPDVIREKVAEAGDYPVLKLKVGAPGDLENLAALRDVAPDKPIRVDANEAWKTKEEALRKLEWLASDGCIEFVEQPMPASTDPKDLAWLKQRAPLPIMADESYRSAADISVCRDCFHAVNVKLVKAGGISGAYEALRAARGNGLKTMLGCMIESSVLITAAAHLAALTDHLDLDGNLLITNDPYVGASARRGMISFAQAPLATGLRVRARLENEAGSGKATV
jgi:L-Ala-D/L-Glu epimerase